MDEMSSTGGLVLFAAFLLGMKFPDWDFRLKLKHRNILTHSPIIMIIFYKIYEIEGNKEFRFFIMGFSMALALHFIFDLFPKGWYGGALLKIPFINISLSPTWSIFLLFIFTVICILITVNYTKSFTEFLFLLFLGLITLIFNVKREKKFVRPLITFGFLYFIMGAVKYEELFRYFAKGMVVLQKAVLGVVTAL
jgi:hypothetical protein